MRVVLSPMNCVACLLLCLILLSLSSNTQGVSQANQNSSGLPLGPETDAFFKRVQKRKQQLPPGAPSQEDPFSLADLNRDGKCDSRDIKLASGKPLIVKEVSGYKSWTKVNPVPLLLPTPLDALCRMPIGVDLIATSSNPHRRKYFTVYVNDVGRSTMMREAKPNFPKNSVIVKEKLLARNSNTPELLTVMVKREEGFNPANGDWEYMVLNGTGTKIEGRGKLENCQSCHVMNKSTDHVFRSYLPEDVRSRLR